MKVRNIYSSSACNRTTEAADWGNNGLVVFGACNAVAIFDPFYDVESAKIINTFVQHSKRVNTVQWLRKSANEKETHILSGSDDGLAILWDISNPEEPKRFLLKGHESGVNAVSGLWLPSAEWLLATASADSTIKLWRKQNDETYQCSQTLLLKEGFCFVLRLTFLPKTKQVLLAFSSDDESISLWGQQDHSKDQKEGVSEFQLVHKLTGHEDWVRGLDFISEGDDILLASSAQDNFIRLWRISPRTEKQMNDNAVDMFNLIDKNTGQIKIEEKILKIGHDAWFAVSLESVLFSHDGWVFGVQWHKSEQGLRLLSASIDKTLIIWELSDDGIWMEKVRVGEIGGNSLGFFGGKFSSDGKALLGHSYQGGFHIWKQSEENKDLWIPGVNVGGHYGEVRDISWEPQGEYLMSISSDQTTRIHAPWMRNKEHAKITWHELARPQIHGYDMQALALLGRYKFASGAEEKIVRTFQSSANFIENFRHITQLHCDPEGDELLENLPKGASVPSLGLSNRAIYKIELPSGDEQAANDYPDSYFEPFQLETPPQEENLMQNTLWPELQKLYGHGYEIFALAATPDGKILASSCRASTAEHAQIILWNTTTWKQIQKLSSHQLTVTQMRFSPDGRFLLSVSRDRRWSLFEKQQDSLTDNYKIAAATDKTNGVHSRIIWSCDWSHDGKYFATSSRDGKVVIWSHSTDPNTKSVNGWVPVDTLELKNESITAVCFAKSTLTCGSYIIALGCENGLIRIYQFKSKWDCLLSLNNHQAHHLTVKRLEFRPFPSEAPNQFQLASCGDDQFVKIYELIL